MVDTEGKIILVNKFKNPYLEFPSSTDNRYGLLFLVLAHIYMSGESCTDGMKKTKFLFA